MPFRRLAPIATALLALSGLPAQASVPVSPLLNGSFELNTAGVGSTGYCYLGGSCAANALSNWSGTAAVIGASSSPWQTPSAIAGWSSAWGDTVVGLQNASYIEQTVSFSGGQVSLSWADANRYGYANAQYQVWLDGNALGTFNTVVGGSWATHSLSFNATAGLHTLRWQGVAIASDATAFVDNLSVTAVPEPASALMALAGLGLIGGLARRRRA